MSQTREKFATQVNSEILTTVRALAQSEGRQRTAFAAPYTFLAINDARLTAGTQETYVFISALYEANQFSFDKLVLWLRNHVTYEPREK